MVKRAIAMLLLAAAPVVWAEGGGETYVGAGGGLLLPGNGVRARRAAEVSVNAGWYATEFLAWEAAASCAPRAVRNGGGDTSVTALAVRGLFHLTGIEEFDLLFGCERFDPFVTFGAAAAFAARHAFADGASRTGIGPAAGVGAFYHLTDEWSLRFDAGAALAAGSPCGMSYALGVGLRRSFGGGGL